MRGHKRRKGDGWELIVDLGRDPVTKRRRQRSRMFKGTSGEADTELAAMVTEASGERAGPGTEAPLSELIDRWLDLVADDLSPTTLEGYRCTVKVQIAPVLGSRPVGEITTAEIDALYRELLKTRKPATVRQTHAILRRAFRQAVRWGWLTVNPAINATPPPVRKKKHIMPTPKQLAALLAAADTLDPDLGCLLRVAATSGARRGELLGLHESRVNLDTGVLLIDRNIVQAGGVLIEKDTKTHQDRSVSLDAGTVAVLRRHLVRARERALAGGIGRALDPYVFSASVDGSVAMTPDVVSAAFRRLAKTHAPGVRLHDLRHFSATQLLAGGVPVKTVSARLGHGSAAMTLDVYAAALPQADQPAADLLGSLLDG